MGSLRRYFSKWCRIVLPMLLLCASAFAQQPSFAQIEKNFVHPPDSAKPWVFWYWMHAAVSKEGITADLEAMKKVGIGGAYLMPIKDTTSPSLYHPVARQLSPEWWEMVRFAMQEAKRLNIRLSMHVSDGFALAGGPWITPEFSMQKLVWSKTYVRGGAASPIQLPQPEANEGYYRDVAVFAYPANSVQAFQQPALQPIVTTSNGVDASFLAAPAKEQKTFGCDSACFIQYEYAAPFTLRSIQIVAPATNYQAQRFIVQSSNDGKNFTTVTRLESPRFGWQNGDAPVTHAIPEITARYFRFVFDKEGTEPGAEDLDGAKWRPSLRIHGLYLSDEPVIHQYESKNGSVWRVSRHTTREQVPDQLAVPLKNIINLTGKMEANGNLRWQPPAGNWTIVRMGHTSTGHTNATAGAGKGLECDKFNPVAVATQFNNWFAKAFEKTDPALAAEVLNLLHVDSWECGSQNWSPVFASEFRKRRGYDPMPYLLAMAGVPVESAVHSEKFLHDIRQTIAELVNDGFYTTLKKLAREKGCRFSAESVAPTMMSDGLLHYKTVDIPMGEFWTNSPTHDKPNDMRDAISGAHIYGKNIVQAEAFTSVRMNWGEHPGNLKIIGDRNFALGINKFSIHVFTHNPWLHRKPGMTLDGVGLYFQRDQTWFEQSKAWIDYLTRCQYLLQQGEHIADIAVFTGEQLPRRSLLPDRLVKTLPGIFGAQKVRIEEERLRNVGQPMRAIPDGVRHSANMADPEDWIDPLNGYQYDSFNPDVLLQATVKDGKVVFPGGAMYALLVIPATHKMLPDRGYMSVPVAKKLLQLVRDGATVLMDKSYEKTYGLQEQEDSLRSIMRELFSHQHLTGRVVALPYTDSTFSKWGVDRDVEIAGNDHTIAWTHRRIGDEDLYFVSNQADYFQQKTISFRVSGKKPELWDAVTGKRYAITDYWENKGRTYINIPFHAGESFFVVFRTTNGPALPVFAKEEVVFKSAVKGPWTVQFDTAYGGPEKPAVFNTLQSWTSHPDAGIQYYSGTAKYKHSFKWDRKQKGKVWLTMDSVFNIATVKVNGIECGTVWTKPYRVDISQAIRRGKNTIEISVSNTWANRLIGDQQLPESKRVTWTTAPFRLAGKPLLPAGIMGTVQVEEVSVGNKK